MKKKILITIALAYVLGVITTPLASLIHKHNLQERVIYTITIDTEYINLRPEIDLNSDIIMKVYKGEQYKVVEYYEGNSYNWYRVIYEDSKTGWLASGKEEPWVIIDKGCK